MINSSNEYIVRFIPIPPLVQNAMVEHSNDLSDSVVSIYEFTFEDHEDRSSAEINGDELSQAERSQAIETLVAFAKDDPAASVELAGFSSNQ